MVMTRRGLIPPVDGSVPDCSWRRHSSARASWQRCAGLRVSLSPAADAGMGADSPSSAAAMIAPDSASKYPRT